MKFNVATVLAFVTSAAAHSTWQQLWVNGVDQASTCARLNLNNNPIGTTTADIRCGNGRSNAASVCEVNGKISLNFVPAGTDPLSSWWNCNR